MNFFKENDAINEKVNELSGKDKDDGIQEEANKLEKPKNSVERDDSLHYMDAVEDEEEDKKDIAQDENSNRKAPPLSSSVCVMIVNGITIKPKTTTTRKKHATPADDDNNDGAALPDPPTSNNNNDDDDDEIDDVDYQKNSILTQIESLYGLTLRPKLHIKSENLILGATVVNVSSSSSDENSIRINDEISGVNGTSITTTTSSTEEWNPTPFNDILSLIQKIMEKEDEQEQTLVLNVARVLGFVPNDAIDPPGQEEEEGMKIEASKSPAAPTLDDIEEAGLPTVPPRPITPNPPTLDDLEKAGLATSPQTQHQNDTVECGLCYETVSKQNTSHCFNENHDEKNNDPRHYLCHDCFCSYATAELQPAGAYEGRRIMTIRTTSRSGAKQEEGEEEKNQASQEFTSEPGQLPCYLFLAGSCTCTSIPPTTIARVLSTNASVLELYEQARRRQIEADVTRSRRIQEETDRKLKENAKPIDLLKIDIQDALVRGCHVSCPVCRVDVQKDDACMHMTCSCGITYCYCCGNERDADVEYHEDYDAQQEQKGETIKCPRFGCDVPSPFLEDHPQWGGYALLNENAGTGALHEFHRQRQVYFLKNVKRKYKQDTWEELSKKEPELLNDIPTFGRSISWDYDGEIENATAPVFGNTRVNKIRWLEKDIVSPNEEEVDDDEEEKLEENIRSICGICMEPTRNANFCVGNAPHALCDECFCGYAGAQFEPTGAFEGERRQNITSGGSGAGDSADQVVVSERGHLPCYLFLTGECNCASIPATTLARVLSTDERVLDLYDQARRRIISADEERNRQEAARAQEESEARETPVDRLRRVVGEALSRGGRTKCPDCDVHVQKNDACMHMECPCGTRFCYCCGRRNGNGQGECPKNGGGCDSQTPFLESYPGWSAFDINGETPGMGALNEFHRLRMMYFLRQVKENCPAEDWEALRRESPGKHIFYCNVWPV